jgi:Histone chaperone domain CHZ
MEEIDTSNILGRRTRGKNIDFAEAAQKAQEAGDTLEEDDSDEDEDFVEGEQVDADKMEE